jgi:hypothetical protein
MSWQGIGLLGIDEENRPYWDRRPIEMRRRLELTFWQTILAWVTAAALVVGAMGIVVVALGEFGGNRGFKPDPHREWRAVHERTARASRR